MRIFLFVFLFTFGLSYFHTNAVFAVDESASDLVARGRLRLMEISDAINKKYKGQKEKFWDISSIAYHDFTGVPEVDVVVGLSGYQDKGGVYNDGKQVVEDAGAGFAYFHKEKDNWVLKQVELVRGSKYDGFEGADLMGLGKDQLVVYSSEGSEKIATIFMMPMNHVLKQVAEVKGKDFGPRVTQNGSHVLLVDFRRALVKNCDDCQVYYGEPYLWKDHHFISAPSDYLTAVEKCIEAGDDKAALQKSLAWFRDYLTNHPNDFGALANSYDLSNELGMDDQAALFKKKLLKLGTDSELNLSYCDSWLSDKNKAFQQQYLDTLQGRSKISDSGQ